MHQHLALGDYDISTDPARLDTAVIHGYLTQSYLFLSDPRAIDMYTLSLPVAIAISRGAEQVGFARVVTDKATFAYLADVFVLEPHRGKGLSKQLMAFIKSHPDLQGLRRFMLGTKDAHGLYKQFGFTELANPARMMEILQPDVYRPVAQARAPLTERP